MPLETATHISGLVASNPASSDGLNQADDHMRLIKQVLLTDVGSSMTNGKLTAPDGTAAAPSITFGSESTLGLYRSAAGLLGVAGGRLVGAAEPGQLGIFVAAPASFGTATAHTGRDWLELNGAVYNASDYPALALRFGVSTGTFTLPDMYSTGRFPRSRTASVAALAAQANTVGPHVHPDVTVTTNTENQNHYHTFSGTTGTDTPDHTHQVTVGAGTNSSNGVTGGGAFALPVSSQTVTSGGANQRHLHSFGGNTSIEQGSHNHTVAVSTPANTGTTETRPEAMAFIFAVKT